MCDVVEMPVVITRLRGVFALLLTMALLAAGCVACGTPASKGPLRVELWGDSISQQSGPYFKFFLGLSHKATGQTHTFPGTALCDWLPDMKRELDPANKAGFHPQAAVIEFSGVAYTKCMRNSAGVPYTGQALINKYAADSAKAIALFAKARVPVYFASVPITRAESAQGYVGDTPLGKMYSRLPAEHPGGIARFIDAALAVEWHGHYTATLPCAAGETCTGRWPDGTKTVVVREADGRHFCPVAEVPSGNSFGWLICPVGMPGAKRYMIAITGRVLHDFKVT